MSDDAPLLRQQVRPEWIDYNGHLSEAYYVLVFGFATDEFMQQVGLGTEYRAATGCSLYTVEAHVRYLREVGPDTELLVHTRVVDAGPKKVRLCHEMTENGQLVATEEIMALHVDDTGATGMPEEVAAQVRQRLEPAPDYAGRSIG